MRITNKYFKWSYRFVLLGLIFLSFACKGTSQQEPLAFDVDNQNNKNEETHEEYIEFFNEVYKTFQDNYFQDVRKEDFDRFLKQFDEKIYVNLQSEGKSNDYIRWRSSALLVDFLKSKEDIFSAFYPPKPAKEYEQTALGVKEDTGIKFGEFVATGYQLAKVEPRSDAYNKGLREGDIIIKINEKSAKEMDEESILSSLSPPLGETVALSFYSQSDQMEKDVLLESTEYFEQAAYMLDMPIEGIYCIVIERFNRKSHEDFYRFMRYIISQKINKGLILDLRGNPGGPPLAARELSGFFLPPGTDFAYFQKKGQPKALLDVPDIPDIYKYEGPIVILINEESGSSSELFSGILQRRGRAVLMGQNSAGQVMLKSMFHFHDGSMLLLITSRGHHPDGAVFSFQGLTPDRYVPDEEMDIIYRYATEYLLYMDRKANKS